MSAESSVRSRGPRPAPDDTAAVERARDLLRTEGLQRAARYLRETDGRTLSEQCELTEIPAPPFGERERALRMAELMRDSGLDEVDLDAEGNVLGRYPGLRSHTPIILSAHLDTVFPAGTDVRVRSQDGLLLGPGIGDDARGLAALLAIARTLRTVSPRLAGPIVFAATVGEEGPGDLRGVRHLFRDGGPGPSARAFISLDGAGVGRIVNAALGVRRYRIAARGPGGHSWIDWGTPNPIHTLASLVTELAELALPRDPTTTLTVARWSGGTSINAIPREAWVEVEVRSEDERVLEDLDGQIRRMADAHHRRATTPVGRERPRLGLSVDQLGHRPAGATDVESDLVRAAVAATRAIGATAELTVSSTDANIPMKLGVPAVTMGAGGEAGRAHTPDEWYRNERGPEGVLRALLTVLLADGGPTPADGSPG
jgi:tripeptide aminopeptidase